MTILRIKMFWLKCANIKKIFVLFFLFFIQLPTLADDYLYKGIMAYNSCKDSNTKCDEAVKYINEGITYYSDKTYDYINLKSYCTLLFLRFSAQSWGDNEQIAKDLLDLNLKCRYL